MERKGGKLRSVFRKLEAPFLVLFVAAVVWGAFLYAAQNHAWAQDRALAAVHEQQGDGALYDINPDYVGWLTVYGPGLETPVVQRSSDGYYRDHDFYGRSNGYGCFYLDSLAAAGGDGNLLIHGLYSENSASLRAVTNYLDVDFFTEHGVICWEYDGQQIYYELFALLLTPENDGVTLTQYVGEPDYDLTQTALDTLSEHALYWRDIPLDGNDRFLFLELGDYPRQGESLVLCAQRLGN